jgi:para-nitrobenzyl esterase
MATVETGGGRLTGRALSQGVAFLGVPYAAAPRWAPPIETPSWVGVLDATSVGPAAPQPDRAVAVFTHGEPVVTDEAGCLNLNVFTPALDGSRPVLVWIHGGGFAIGRAGSSIYWGERLAAATDSVVVTVNYRLGSLGWLGHPDLATGVGAPSANWGLLDQIEALRWVQANIGVFGGDASCVTLAGQSAGALGAMDLLVAPAAKGMFRRVILQSPPLGDAGQPLAVAVHWAQALSDAAGGQAGQFDLARLRSLAAPELVALHEQLLDTPEFRGTRGGALPTVEPGTLPRSPVAAPESSPGVDVLIGHNADEGTFFFRSPWRPPPPPERIAGIAGHLLHSNLPDSDLAWWRQQAISRGEASDDLSLLVQIATEAMVAGPLAHWAQQRAAAVAGRSSVYRYRVDHPGAEPPLAATHTVEVPLLFGTWDDGGPGQRLGGHASGTDAVASRLVNSWGAFVHGESPGWCPLAAERDDDELGVFGGAAVSAVESLRARTRRHL